MRIFYRNGRAETSQEASTTSPSPTANDNDDKSRDHRVNKPTELMIACQRQNIDDVRALLTEKEVKESAN